MYFIQHCFVCRPADSTCVVGCWDRALDRCDFGSQTLFYHSARSLLGLFPHAQETRKCLDAGRGNSMDVLYVAPCQNLPTQVWFFDHYVD